jgi:hypothetical protein
MDETYIVSTFMNNNTTAAKVKLKMHLRIIPEDYDE